MTEATLHVFFRKNRYRASLTIIKRCKGKCW